MGRDGCVDAFGCGAFGCGEDDGDCCNYTGRCGTTTAMPAMAITLKEDHARHGYGIAKTNPLEMARLPSQC